MLPVVYRSLDFLGYPAYRVGTDGSIWSKRFRSDRLFAGEDAAKIRDLHAGGRSINSLTREYSCSNRAIIRCLSGDRDWKRLVAADGPNNYKTTTLRNMDGKGQVSFLIHRIVLLAFVGPCPDGMEARHFPDNDRGNNCLENLSWATKQVNEADKIFHGTLTCGERNGMSKLTRANVEEVRLLASQGVTREIIAGKFGITKEHVSALVSRKRWRNDADQPISQLPQA